MVKKLETLSETKCFGGTVGFYKHQSSATNCAMQFSVYQPLGEGPFPVLTWLSGLTCTEENFQVKSGIHRLAAQYGCIVVNPDTSPRGCDIDGEDDDWDFGSGAGFYLDATQNPWAKNYRMYSYVIKDLQQAVFSNFPGVRDKQGIFGHSMGGHGAISIGLKHPEIFSSISAFAPICAPSECPWGQKAFRNYLGSDEADWHEYDSVKLIAGIKDAATRSKILIDQGLDDDWLENELHPHLLEKAAAESGYPLTVRRQQGYDHGYYFIATFLADHIVHHAKYLQEID